MCDICLSTPCLPQCPNAPDPPMVYKCINCGEKILEGDGYYDIDGEIWCEDCIEDCHREAEVEE
jgi:hypothetical protein